GCEGEGGVRLFACEGRLESHVDVWPSAWPSMLDSLKAACSNRRRTNQLHCRVAVIPAQNARLLAFERRHRNEELFDLLADAAIQGYFSPRGDRYRQNSIVADAASTI